ncbi:MAG: hypothetical protein ACREQB_09540 [Candidatus Binataceae bacterium]
MKVQPAACFAAHQRAGYHCHNMATTRQVLETTIDLEKQSMALYARFAKIFASNPKLRDFWFGMARDEARHVGALDLVETVLDMEGKLDADSPVSLDDAIIGKLRGLLGKYRRDDAMPRTIERALAIAVEVEETELEDMVADLLRAVQSPDEYERCMRLLVHDLGELSYMIEQHSQDAALQERCDALVNRHAESLRANTATR